MKAGKDRLCSVFGMRAVSDDGPVVYGGMAPGLERAGRRQDNRPGGGGVRQDKAVALRCHKVLSAHRFFEGFLALPLSLGCYGFKNSRFFRCLNGALAAGWPRPSICGLKPRRKAGHGRG